MDELSEVQRLRYAGLLALPGMSDEVQQTLLASSVAILGVKGSGIKVAEYLAYIGIGKIGLVDEKARLDLPAKVLGLVNSDCEIVSYDHKFDSKSDQLIAGYDVVIDSLSSWQDKLLASDICMQLGKPLVHGGIVGFRCHAYTMIPGKSACLRCVLPLIGMEDVPLMPEGGAQFEPATGIVAAIQVSEAIKLIGNLGGAGGNSLFQFDVLSFDVSNVRGLTAKDDCPDCRKR